MTTMKRVAAAGTCVVLAAAAFAGPVDAAKGGKGGGTSGGGSDGTGDGSSVALVILDGSAPSIGDLATFNVSSSTETVWVAAKCTQGGQVVYQENHGFYPSYPWGQTYTLGPTSLWESGDASCTAELYTVSGRKQTKKTLAITYFIVGG